MSAQPLYEFTNNLLEDLSTGRISPEEALIALEQYGYLRGVAAESLDGLAGSLTNTEQFSSQLRALVSRALGQLNNSLPQLRQAQPDGALTPAEIAARAQSFASARGHLASRLTTTRRAFITTLVNNWLEQTRGDISQEQAQAGAGLIESTLTNALATNTNLDAAVAQTKLALEKSLPLPGNVLEAAYQAIQSVHEPRAREARAFSRIANVPTIILKHPEIRRADWFTSVLMEELTASEAPVPQVEEFSVRLTKTAEALSLPPPPIESIMRSGVFQSFAKEGVQKSLAAVADGVFLFLGPETRDRVLKIVLAKSAQRLLADTDSLTKRLGGAFVESPVFAQIKQKLQETIASPRDGASALTKTKSLFGDLFTTIVGSPIGERLVGSPREAMYTYLETLRANAVLPPERRMWQTTLPASPSWQYMYLSAISAQPITGGALTAFSLPSPQMQTSSAPGGFAGFLLGTAAGLGSLAAAPFSLLRGGVGGGLWGLLGRGVEGLFGSTLPGRILAGARRGQAIPTRLVDDMPLLVSLVVIVVLVVLFVLPSFLNLPFVSRTSQGGALLFGTEEDSFCDPAVDPQCAAAHCNPELQNCQWPIEGRGCVTQGPQGDFSHHGLNAIDIGAPQGTLVYAAHDGTIMGCNGDGGHYETSFAVDEFQRGSYGNIVEIQGTDGTNSFSTLYAHLERVLVAPCQSVVRGQAIGTVDNNGNSYGNHLHFEYRGGGSVWSILPPGLTVGVCYDGGAL